MKKSNIELVAKKRSRETEKFLLLAGLVLLRKK